MDTPPSPSPSFEGPSFEERARSLGFATLADILSRDYPLHLIRGLLPQVGTSCAFGAPGLGKSFMALDIALSIAAGYDAFGRKTLHGAAFYLSTEGKTGMRARAEAWAKARGHTLKDLPVAILEEPWNLRDKEKVTDLIARLRHLENGSGSKCRFICIDTLSQCLFGDENRQEHVVEFCRAMTQIANELETHVCVIHHTGKDESKGARGSSVITGNFDTLLHLTANEGPRDLILHTGKQKNGAKVGIRLLLDEYLCGEDADGETVTSLAVSPLSGESFDIEPSGPSSARAGGLSQPAQVLFDLLKAAGDEGLERTDLHRRAREAGVGPNRPATAREIVERLEAQGRIRENERGRLVAL